MGWAQGGPSLGSFVLWNTAPRKNPGVACPLLMAPPSCNPGSLRIPGLFTESQSVHAPGGKMSPTLVQAASVCVALHILEGEEIKPSNFCLDEEYMGALRKNERWEGSTPISIVNNPSTRLLPSPHCSYFTHFIILRSGVEAPVHSFLFP